METLHKTNGSPAKPGDKPNNDKFVTLIVVVNTKPASITMNENAPLKAVAEKALAETKSTGRKLEDYELKWDDLVLDMDKKIREYNFPDGTELFLSLKAGIGGTH